MISPVFTPVRVARAHSPVSGSSSSLRRPELVAHLERPLGMPSGGHPRGERGMPNTAMTASPMNFSTTPPCRSSGARKAVK